MAVWPSGRIAPSLGCKGKRLRLPHLERRSPAEPCGVCTPDLCRAQAVQRLGCVRAACSGDGKHCGDAAFCVPASTGLGRRHVCLRTGRMAHDMRGPTIWRVATSVVNGAAGPAPLIPDTVGAVLVGQAPSEALLNTAAALARTAACPRDALTSAAYRAHIAGLLTRRALGIALCWARRNHRWDEQWPEMGRLKGGIRMQR